MHKFEKRQIFGVKVFVFLACLIILIGVIMKIVGGRATGKVDPRGGTSTTTNLSGEGVIGIGAIMLALIFLIYITEKGKKSSKQYD